MRTSSEQVQLRVRREYPEPVMLSPERLHRRPLRQVPHANGLVLTTRHDKFVFRVEKRGRDVVEVPSTRIHLPCLRLAHTPQLDLPVIARRDDEWKCGVERRPVDATVMTLQDPFDGRERVKGVKCSWRSVRGALAQRRDVPDTDCLIDGGRDDQVVTRVERGRHDVVRVSGQDGNAVSRRAVPDADSLVVGRRELVLGARMRR